jgi:hypothetical protein
MIREPFTRDEIEKRLKTRYDKSDLRYDNISDTNEQPWIKRCAELDQKEMH